MSRAIGRLLTIFVAIIIAAGAIRPAMADAPYVLVNADTGTVLAQRQSGDLWYPASLTKLMTVYITFQALRAGRVAMDSPVVVSERALDVQPSMMGFPAGTVVTLDNAIKMLVVKSANDIAIAVAETLGGSVASFVTTMNREASRLGLTGTHFVNPHGLPQNGQSSNARDLAQLALAVWTEFPEYRFYFGIPAIRYGATIMPAGNSLLTYYAGATGMKTGYICSSGYNLVATATRNGVTLLLVLLGESSAEARAITAAGLFDAGFEVAAQGNVQLPMFRPISSTAAPTDMRPTLCPNNPAIGDDTIDIDAVLREALGPPRVDLLANAVEVTTGGANPDAVVMVDIPLPRPRPAPPAADILGVAMPPAATTGVPLPRPRPQL